MSQREATAIRYRYRLAAALALLLGALLAGPARAGQTQQLGDYQAHYTVLPTMFLKPAIAADYGITRARNRALVNVAIIDPDTGPVAARVSGRTRDLLSQERTLPFEEVREGDAVYYLATLEHDDRETVRFFIDVRTPDGRQHSLEFQQELYWQNR